MLWHLLFQKELWKINLGLINDKKTLITNMAIDNTPPHATFKEISNADGKSKAEIRLSERVIPIDGWDTSSTGLMLSKDFPNSISYILPIVDLAQNSSEVLIDIKNATNILLEYGTYDDCSSQTLVTSGKITAPNTISSNSICKSESIFIRMSGNVDSNVLQGKVYVYTYWGDGARAVCLFAEQFYYHGYNPSSSSNWWNIGSNNLLNYNSKIFSQFGGVGLNRANRTSSIFKPIPSDIASQYLYGISGIQFKLKDNSNFSVVYQSYIKEIGWLKCSFDGEENLYQHDKPISSFRINLVPKTEKQYLIDFWNRDVGTNHIN